MSISCQEAGTRPSLRQDEPFLRQGELKRLYIFHELCGARTGTPSSLLCKC
jgi:hypothetical protein